MERDERGLELLVGLAAGELRVLALERREPLAHARRGDRLQDRIERGEDPQALAGERLGGIARLQLAADEVDEVRRVVPVLHRRAQHHRLGACRRGLGGVDRAPLEHRREHDIASRARPIEVAIRRVPVGRADDAGEERHLGGREVAELFAEVELCRFRDAEDAFRAALAEVDLVQVQLQDLRLRVATLGDDGHHELDRFAA